MKRFLFNQDVNPLYDLEITKVTGNLKNRLTIKYSDFTTVIWKLDKDQYSRFIVDGYSPDNDAVAHNNT